MFFSKTSSFGKMFPKNTIKGYTKENILLHNAETLIFYKQNITILCRAIPEAPGTNENDITQKILRIRNNTCDMSDATGPIGLAEENNNKK